MRPFCSVLIILALATLSYGQSFAAASIRRNTTGNNGRQSMTPGRIGFVSVSLKECLMTAYDMRGYQIAGPASLSVERYDISAAAEGPASSAELKTMLRTLLAERFRLKAHTETRELPAYRLVITKHIPRVASAAADKPPSYALDGGAVVFRAMSMAGFADYLSLRGPIDRPVIDGTGVDGVFDFQLKLFEARPDMPLNELKRAYYEWDQGSSIFTDLQEQLGMKLQAEKAPIQVLAVDSVSRPSEN